MTKKITATHPSGSVLKGTVVDEYNPSRHSVWYEIEVEGIDGDPLTLYGSDNWSFEVYHSAGSEPEPGTVVTDTSNAIWRRLYSPGSKWVCWGASNACTWEFINKEYGPITVLGPVEDV